MKSLNALLLISGLTAGMGAVAHADGPPWLGQMSGPVPPQNREPRTTEVESGFSIDSLNGGHSDWTNRYLTMRKRLGDGRMFSAGLRTTERYGRRDLELSVGAVAPLSERDALLVDVSASPSHRVLPGWSVAGQWQRHLGAGWNVQAGVRRGAYEAASVSAGRMTVERYWDRYRAAYTFHPATVDGGRSALGHSVSTSYYYGGGSDIGITCAVGEEVDSLGEEGVLIGNVRGVTLSGRHWWDSRWAVTYDLGVTRQGRHHTRKSVRIGVRRPF